LPVGCYTSARYEAGAIRHLLRHARRLARDAAALGWAPPDEASLARALLALGGEGFGDGAGVVRLSLRPDAERPGETLNVGETRPLGIEPRLWRAIIFCGTHPGAGVVAGAKREGVACHDAARAASREAQVDDALLFDRAGLLVEAARTNVFVVGGDGALRTPPLGRGAVAGVAREIVLERVAEAREADVPREALAAAREIVLVNAIRGAVRVCEIDGLALKAAAGGGWTERLHALLLSDPPP
jgi:branched-subunit amino acid aminotransferase/4-amino-4-deoxychorismate lyase